MSLYQFFCDQCCWKRITENPEQQDLVIVLTSPVPKGIPHLDPVDKKIITQKPKILSKRYKCPRCGYIIKAKKIDDPQEEVKQKMDMERRIQKRVENDEKERMKQIERQQKKIHRSDGSQTSLE